MKLGRHKFFVIWYHISVNPGQVVVLTTVQPHLYEQQPGQRLCFQNTKV